MRWFLLIGLSITFQTIEAAGTRKQNIDPGLLELVDKIDEKSTEVESLRARFLQRKEISLLTEPVEMEGMLFLKKPDGLKFEFDPEEDLVLIINSQEMVSLSPKAKKASRIEMRKRRTELTRGILSEKLETLLAFFSVTRVEGQSGNRLMLLPTKRKMKKRFQDIQLWFDQAFMIYRIKVTLKDGDIYELTLSDIEVNVDLSPSLFDTSVPADFDVGDRMEYIFGSDVTF